MTELALPLLAALGLGVALWVLVRSSQRLDWGLLALIFFMPFERIPSLDVLGVTLKINHLFGASLMALWLLGVLFARRPIMPNPLAPLFGLLSASFLVSFLSAEHGSRAGVVFLVTLFTFGLGLLVPQLLTRREQLRPVLQILGVTTLLTLVFGLYQFAGDMVGLPISLTGLDPGYIKDVFGFPRIQAFAQEPLYLGNFLLLPISVTMALIAMPQQWFSRPVLFGFLGLSGLVFALTLSRGAFVGLVGALVVLFMLLAKRVVTPRTIGLVGGGVAVAVLATAVILAVISPDSQRRFLDHLTVQDFGRGESTVGRLQTWFQAVELWQISPLIGVGPGNFGPAVLDYPNDRPPRGWPIVNNEYFELLAETGLVGLGLFLVFVFVLLGRSWRAYLATKDDPELRAVVVGLSAAIVGILFQYNFFSTLYINPVWISFGLLMAAQTIALRREDKRAV